MTQDYKIRTAFIFLLFCSLYLIALFNLYLIQIKQRDFYLDLGNKQYNVLVTTMPPRAEIYDRTRTQKLALNQDNLAAFVLPKELKNQKQLTAFLQKHFPKAVGRLKHNKSHFMYIQRKLSEAQLELIKKSNIEDIQILKEQGRYYPIESAGPIVGITNIDNRGLFGVELIYDKQLAGSPYTYQLEKDARSGHFYFKKETKVEGHQGSAITLTIDSDLQFLAYEELKNTVEKFQAKEGAVLVMDPTTGEILVMANYPTFDPNNSQKLDIALTKNKIITNAYEPGSVMKVFLALAAFEENVVTPDELIDCENIKVGKVNGVKFSTVHPAGVIPFWDVIAHSNNFGTAKVALRLGPTLYDHYTRVGFGKKTGIDWPGEHFGYVNPPNKWSRGSIIVLSFGYEIMTTLLQFATAFSIFANEGHLVYPKLLLDNPVKKSPYPLYSPQAINTMRTILEQTVSRGTGKKAAIKGYKILGKTGTANLVIDGHYSPEHSIFSFSGIIEKGNYKRLVITFIKEVAKQKIYADTVATPLFEKITEKLLIHDKII